jgi:hypothetical protein
MRSERDPSRGVRARRARVVSTASAGGNDRDRSLHVGFRRSSFGIAFDDAVTGGWFASSTREGWSAERGTRFA